MPHNAGAMRTLIALRWPAAIGAGLTLPLAALEFVNTRGFSNGVPVALFFTLGALSTACAAILTPIVRDIRTRTIVRANPVSLLLRVAALVALASVWVAVTWDQTPCFLGVPNCD